MVRDLWLPHSINILKYTNQILLNSLIRIKWLRLFTALMYLQMGRIFSLAWKEENLLVKQEQRSRYRLKLEISQRMRKIKFSIGLRVTNKRNLHIIINIFIVEYMKKLKATILNSSKNKAKKWANMMSFWRNSNTKKL